MALTVSLTCIVFGATWLLIPIINCCTTRDTKEYPVYDNWKPFGIYKGHVLYERLYESGKKSWRYENKEGDGHIYLSATTVQNENITPL